MLVSRRLLLLVVLLAANFSSTSFFVVGASFRFGAGSHNSNKMPDEDPYKVLGIKHRDRNNMDAIKKAYREMARKSHPDKNPNLDQETANQNFHRINSAYEYLSDTNQKRFYDNNHRRQEQHHHQQQQRRNSQEEARRRAQDRQKREEMRKRKEEEARKQREINKLVKEAQARVLKVTTLEDLISSNVIDEKTMRFQKHFLCVFVSNKKIETISDNEYNFPYPFGPSGPNGVDWGNLIQTAKVRFNKATTFTNAFDVPTRLSKPYIVFVEKGSLFQKDIRFEVYIPRKFKSIDDWVFDKLRTTVSVVNKNPKGSPSIKVYRADPSSKGDSKIVLTTSGKSIPPGFMLEIPAKLSHRFIVIDESTNEFVGNTGPSHRGVWEMEADVVDSIAMDDVVVTEKGQTFNVGAGHGTTRTCYDMSIDCRMWLQQETGNNKCERYPAFAHTMCAKSCGVCIESPCFNGLHYLLLHAPIHKFPDGILLSVFRALREVAKFLVVVGHDFLHLWTMRRTVTAAFLVGGLLLGIQIDLLVRMVLEQKQSTSTSSNSNTKNIPSLLVLGFWFYSTGFMALLLFYVYQATRASDLFNWKGLVSFHYDLVNMRRESPEIAIVFLCIGIASLLVSKVLTYPLFRRPGRNLLGRVCFLAMSVAVSYGMIIAIDFYFDKETHKSRLVFVMSNKWDRVLMLYKNVAAAVTGLGHLVGNTMFLLMKYLKYKLSTRKNVHLLASLVNVSASCALFSLALKDPYFLEDFEHVVSMRMSAAIPCLVIGMLLGVIGAHGTFHKSPISTTTNSNTSTSTTKVVSPELKEKVE